MIRQLISITSTLVMAFSFLPVAAQNFPEKPVTLIVPYSAGGATDVAMRALADAAAKQLGQLVKILHDAFRKAMDDPAYQRVLERLDQDNVYLSSENYAKFAQQLNDEQKAVVQRMGLKQ